MDRKVAKLTEEDLKAVQKTEKKLAELGRDIILIAYEAEER